MEKGKHGQIKKIVENHRITGKKQFILEEKNEQECPESITIILLENNYF